MVVEIRRTVRRSPTLPYARVATRILPRTYQLSIVVCGDSLSRKLNKAYRKKTYAANVLSFPLSSHEGELFINVDAAAREARRFGTTPKKRLALLFVHGLLHLKGLHHGRTMDRREEEILSVFDLA